MKSILIFLFSVGVLLSTQAFSQNQNYKTKVGEKTPYKSNITKKIIGKIDNKTYAVVKEYYNGFLFTKILTRIEVYDKKLNLIESGEIDLKNQGAKQEDAGTYILGGKIFQFGTHKDSKKNNVTLYARQLVQSKTEQPHNWIKVMESNYDKKIDRNQMSNEKGNKFIINKSQNDSFLIVTSCYRKDDKIKDSTNFYVFNQNMELLWSKKIQTLYIFTLIESIEMSNKGEVIVILQNNPSNDIVRKALDIDTLQHTNIYIYSENLDDPKKIEIQQKDNIITQNLMKFDNNNNLYCSGLYLKLPFNIYDFESRVLHSQGSFCYKINLDNKQVEYSKFIDFDLKFVNQYKSERKSQKLENKINSGKFILIQPDVEVQDVYISSTSFVTLLAESRSIVTETEIKNNTTYVSRTCNYDNIYILGFDTKDTNSYFTKINKLSESSSPNNLGFCSAMYEDELYVLYNDNPSNDDIENPKEYKTFKDNNFPSVILYKISQDGKLVRNKLFGNSNSENDATKTNNKLSFSSSFQDNNTLYYFSPNHLIGVELGE